MLQQIFIIVDGKVLYQRSYAKGLDNSVFESIFPKLKQDIFSKFSKEIGYYDFFKSKISYIVDKNLDVAILFISGLTDNFERIKIELFKLMKDFLINFGDYFNKDLNSSMLEIMNPTLDAIHKNLMPKISIIGFSGVGKTTITNLIKEDEIPMTHIPTITGDVSAIKIGNLYFFLWDFAGQEQFSFLWNKFIRGSDALLLISDSTLDNLEKSKFFLDIINEEAPYANSAIIANKQDLLNATSVETIENLMGLKAYPMIAIDPKNKSKMVQIIAELLEINPEISPLLKPIYERNKLIDDVNKELQQGNHEYALTLFERIANISIELGDKSLEIEFKEKAEKLKKILKSQSITSEKAFS